MLQLLVILSEFLYFEVSLMIEINFGLHNKFEVLADLTTFPDVRE